MTTKMGFVFCAMLGLSLQVGSARAEEESEKVRVAKIESALEEAAKSLAAKCGAKVETKVDWKSFPADLVKKYAMDDFCSSSLEAVEALCRGPATKAYIAKRISSFVCTYGGEGKRGLTVEKGAIKLSVDFGAPNYDEFCRKALVEKL